MKNVNEAAQLADALKLIEEAFHIVLKCKLNKDFMPTKKDIELFEKIERSFFTKYCQSGFVVKSMVQRMYGLVEEELIAIGCN